MSTLLLGLGPTIEPVGCRDYASAVPFAPQRHTRARAHTRNGGATLADEREQDLDDDQEDDREFEELRACGRRAVGEHIRDLLNQLELAVDAALPLVEVEARRGPRVDLRQVEVADELQRVRQPLA